MKLSCGTFGKGPIRWMRICNEKLQTMLAHNSRIPAITKGSHDLLFTTFWSKWWYSAFHTAWAVGLLGLKCHLHNVMDASSLLKLSSKLLNFYVVYTCIYFQQNQLQEVHCLFLPVHQVVCQSSVNQHVCRIHRVLQKEILIESQIWVWEPVKQYIWTIVTHTQHKIVSNNDCYTSTEDTPTHPYNRAYIPVHTILRVVYDQCSSFIRWWTRMY